MIATRAALGDVIEVAQINFVQMKDNKVVFKWFLISQNCQYMKFINISINRNVVPIFAINKTLLRHIESPMHCNSKYLNKNIYV